jgi:hypothetical protein
MSIGDYLVPTTGGWVTVMSSGSGTVYLGSDPAYQAQNSIGGYPYNQLAQLAQQGSNIQRSEPKKSKLLLLEKLI